MRYSRELGLVHINTGDLLRVESRSGSDIGKKVAVYMKAGELVPDEIMIELVQKKLEEKGTTNRFPIWCEYQQLISRMVYECGV
jgi:adenylate kinase